MVAGLSCLQAKAARMEDVIAALLVPLVLCAKLQVFIAALFGPLCCGRGCEYLSRSNSQNRLRAFALSGANRTSIAMLVRSEVTGFCAFFTRPERSAGRPGLAGTDRHRSPGAGPRSQRPAAPSSPIKNASTHSREARKASSLKHVRPADTGSPRGSPPLAPLNSARQSLTDQHAIDAAAPR